MFHDRVMMDAMKHDCDQFKNSLSKDASTVTKGVRLLYLRLTQTIFRMIVIMFHCIHHHSNNMFYLPPSQLTETVGDANLSHPTQCDSIKFEQTWVTL